MKFIKNLSPEKGYLGFQALREIDLQIRFALTAFENITKKGEGDLITTFSSIHSFLTHCANISRLLWSPASNHNSSIKKELGDDLSALLNIPTLSLLKNRKFRDDLDHYDERLIEWIKNAYPNKQATTDLVIGEKLQNKGMLYLRHYEPQSHVYTFNNKELNLKDLHDEITNLSQLISISLNS